MLVGPVNVELAGVAQSTWNSQISRKSWPAVPGGLWASSSRWRMNGFGAPAGGGVAPSASAGIRAWKPKAARSGAVKRWAVATPPTSICARSKA